MNVSCNKNQLRKTFSYFLMGALLFGFVSSNDALAQNNQWRTSAPNPPSGITEDESALVSNGGTPFDMNLFVSEVEAEKQAVTNSNMRQSEKTSRIKLLDEALSKASEGFTIEASFAQSFLALKDTVFQNFPNINFASIRDEYIEKFEQ